jgi:hypothetical protein
VQYRICCSILNIGVFCDKREICIQCQRRSSLLVGRVSEWCRVFTGLPAHSTAPPPPSLPYSSSLSFLQTTLYFASSLSLSRLPHTHPNTHTPSAALQPCWMLVWPVICALGTHPVVLLRGASHRSAGASSMYIFRIFFVVLFVLCSSRTATVQLPHPLSHSLAPSRLCGHCLQLLRERRLPQRPSRPGGMIAKPLSKLVCQMVISV